MKRGCLVSIAMVVVAIAAMLVFVFGATKGVVDASDAFLKALGEGKTAEAYASGGNALRAQGSEAAFAEAVRRLGLDKAESAFWSTRKVENDRGQVEGTVTLRGGAKLPLRIALMKEDGAWRVIGFRTDTGAGEAGKAPLPSAEAQKALARETLGALAAALRSGDWAALHGKLSTIFQQQVTPEKLSEALAPLGPKADAIAAAAAGAEPIFDAPPAIDEQGVLVLKGYYPTQPDRVHFLLNYLYQHPEWKPLGINADVVPAGAPAEAPAETSR